jgi:hypothetical protein
LTFAEHVCIAVQQLNGSRTKINDILFFAFVLNFFLVNTFTGVETQSSFQIHMNPNDNARAPQQPWTPERANQWYAEKDWLVGCNYAPSTAVNQLEMWEAETFDPHVIDRELSWAARLGFNSIRVFLHHLLWEHDAPGLIARMEVLLSIADRHRIGVMFVLFDGVWNPHPVAGKRESTPGVHNSGWLQSPGVEILTDPTRHDSLEPYVRGIIRHFANDARVHVWDLFNEPDNLNASSYGKLEPANKAHFSLMLLQKTFQWAREENPSQPLTAGVWAGEWTEDALTPIDRYMLNASDVISFHNYDGPAEIERRINILQRFNRPIICTEFMARGFSSTFSNIFPIFRKHHISAYNWGLVAGKTQTNLPWDSWSASYADAPAVWFHDIFHADGTPYSADEVDFIMSFTAVRK